MPRPRPVRSLLVALALAPAVALLPAAPSTAAPAFPDTVALPADYYPEGITGGPGTTFFAGSRTSPAAAGSLGGGIYRGDLRTGRGEVLVPQQPGGASIGMQYDEATGLLWVAGGGTGTITAYDGGSGALVARYTAPATGGPVFLNDVDVSSDGVYVTDSRNARLLVVRDGALEVLPLSGDWVQAAPDRNSANGIRVLPGGDPLVVSPAGLFRVDPRTGVARELPQTSGTPLTGGDGLELRGSTLYVVFGFGRDSVAVASLDRGARSFAVTGELTKDLPDADDLERPTTALFAAGSLWVVNGKFSSPRSADQEVVRLDP